MKKRILYLTNNRQPVELSFFDLKLKKKSFPLLTSVDNIYNIFATV